MTLIKTLDHKLNLLMLGVMHLMHHEMYYFSCRINRIIMSLLAI